MAVIPLPLGVEATLGASDGCIRLWFSTKLRRRRGILVCIFLLLFSVWCIIEAAILTYVAVPKVVRIVVGRVRDAAALLAPVYRIGITNLGPVVKFLEVSSEILETETTRQAKKHRQG